MSSHGLLYSSNALTNELKQWKVNETTYSFWFKTYYIKTAVLAEGQIDTSMEWNWEFRNKASHIRSIDFSKRIWSQFNGENGLCSNGAGITGISTRKTMKLDLYLTPYTKWIRDQNIKAKTKKNLLLENCRRKSS